MSAYVFFDILEITDQRKMEGYGRQIGLTVENYGERSFVRGGRLHVVEGGWHPVHSVIMEFLRLEWAPQWDESDDYKEPRALRSEAANLNAAFIEGV